MNREKKLVALGEARDTMASKQLIILEIDESIEYLNAKRDKMFISLFAGNGWEKMSDAIWNLRDYKKILEGEILEIKNKFNCV